MTEHTVNTTYEPFSREPEYIEGNREFLKIIPFKKDSYVLDLACGTGAISELIFEREPNINILGLDLSRESLALGKEDFIAMGLHVESPLIMTGEIHGGRPNLTLIEGTADNLPFIDKWADVVFMGHSIHMLPDVDELLAEVARVISPDGFFAFNSSFYAGSQAPGTDNFYQCWWKAALGYIMDKDKEQKKAGLPGISRKRGTAPKAFSSPWYSKDEWIDNLDRHGFEIESINERTIMMSQSNLELIGSYAGLARLMISGYPVALASEALVNTVGPAMENAGLDVVPRLWLEVVAKRKRA